MVPRLALIVVLCLLAAARAVGQRPSGGTSPEERCRAKMSAEGGDWTVLTAPAVTKEQADVCQGGDGQPCTPIGITRYLSREEVKQAYARFGKVVRVGPGLDAQADICVDARKAMGDGGKASATLIPYVRFRHINLDL